METTPRTMENNKPNSGTFEDCYTLSEAEGLLGYSLAENDYFPFFSGSSRSRFINRIWHVRRANFLFINELVCFSVKRDPKKDKVKYFYKAEIHRIITYNSENNLKIKKP